MCSLMFFDVLSYFKVCLMCFDVVFLLFSMANITVHYVSQKPKSRSDNKHQMQSIWLFLVSGISTTRGNKAPVICTLLRKYVDKYG